jgi:hypothetical protein
MDKVPQNMPVWRDMAVRRPDSPSSRLSGALAGVSFHVPIRPNWICAGCGAPWPCGTRRSHLLAEFDSAPVSLALLMGGYFIDAAQDLRTEAAHVLYQRFMGWLKEQPKPFGAKSPSL